MSIQTSISTSATISKHAAKKIYVLAFTVMSMSSMISVSAQAAGLGELFSNNTAKKSKFLPVEQAFQVSSSTKAMSKGTRLSIAVDITPGHYVYKNKLTMSFPKGVSATPFTFSQSPVSIDDPTFGKNVPVVIGWQGCAKAGLCYPPEKIKTTVNIAVQ